VLGNSQCNCDEGLVFRTTDQTCVPCGPGTSYDASRSACQECEAGQFSNSTPGVCLTCADNTVSLAGASECMPCASHALDPFGDGDFCGCDIGFYETGTPRTGQGCIGPDCQCSPCPRGFYKDQVTVAGMKALETGTLVEPTCVPCAAGTFTNITGATSRGQCTVCSDGQFQSEVGAQSCMDCPQHSISSPDRSLCLCDKGYYRVLADNAAGMECMPCPAGYYQDLVDQEQCKPCPAGTFSNQIAAAAVTVCKSCPGSPGMADYERIFVMEADGLSGDRLKGVAPYQAMTTCLACPLMSDPSQVDYKTCECLQGYYRNEIKFYEVYPQDVVINSTLMRLIFEAEARSLTTDMLRFSDEALGYTCSPCSAGYFKDKTNFEAACTPCPVGRYNNVSAATTECDCVSCPEGKIAPAEGSAECQDCPEGATVQAGRCACAAGTRKVLLEGYQDDGDASLLFRCEACPPGTFSEEIDQLQCKLCPAGTANPESRSTSQDTCLPCESEAVSQDGSPRCYKCITTDDVRPAAGTEERDNVFCGCKLGYYRQPDSTLPDTEHSEYLKFRCIPCAAGQYQDAGLNQPNCSMCPRGSYNPNTGAAAKTDCAPCGSGVDTFQGYTLDVGQAKCLRCPPNSQIHNFGRSCMCNSEFFAQYDIEDANKMDGNEIWEPNLLGSELGKANKTCTPCPTGGGCPGNDLLIGREGYWRSDINKTIFYQCRPDFCLDEAPIAAETTLESLNGPQCRLGHNKSTALCGSCQWVESEDNLWLMGSETCNKCSEKAHSTLYRFVVVFSGMLVAGAVVYVVFLRPFCFTLEKRFLAAMLPEWIMRVDAFAVMDGPWEEVISVFQDLFAALKMIGTGSIFKILLTFSQIVSSMFENLFVPWPSFVSYGIQIYSWFDLDLLTATSVMCSFPRQNHYSKLLNATLLPVGGTLLVVAIYLCGVTWAHYRSLDEMTVIDFRNRCHRGWMFLLFIIYPSVSQIVFTTFNCKELYDEHYIAADVTLKCYDARHQGWMAYASVCVIVYTLGIPLIFVYYLYEKKVPAIVQQKEHSTVIISLMEYCVRKQLLQFENLQYISTVDEVQTDTLRKIHDALCKDEYAPNPDYLMGYKAETSILPSEKIARRAGRVMEQYHASLESRSVLLKYLCRWAKEHNIARSALDWAETEEDLELVLREDNNEMGIDQEQQKDDRETNHSKFQRADSSFRYDDLVALPGVDESMLTQEDVEITNKNSSSSRSPSAPATASECAAADKSLLSKPPQHFSEISPHLDVPDSSLAQEALQKATGGEALTVLKGDLGQDTPVARTLYKCLSVPLRPIESLSKHQVDKEDVEHGSPLDKNLDRAHLRRATSLLAMKQKRNYQTVHREDFEVLRGSLIRRGSFAAARELELKIGRHLGGQTKQAKAAEMASRIAAARCGFLYTGYKPEAWYFEVVELLRKLIYSAFLIFVEPGSVSQVLVTVFFSFWSLALITWLDPMSKSMEGKFLTACNQQVFLIALIGLVYKAQLFEDSYLLELLLVASMMAAFCFPLIIILMAWSTRIQHTSVWLRRSTMLQTTQRQHSRRMQQRSSKKEKEMKGSFGHEGFGNKFEYALKYVRDEREFMDKKRTKSGISKDVSAAWNRAWEKIKKNVPPRTITRKSAVKCSVESDNEHNFAKVLQPSTSESSKKGAA